MARAEVASADARVRTVHGRSRVRVIFQCRVRASAGTGPFVPFPNRSSVCRVPWHRGRWWRTHFRPWRIRDHARSSSCDRSSRYCSSASVLRDRRDRAEVVQNLVRESRVRRARTYRCGGSHADRAVRRVAITKHARRIASADVQPTAVIGKARRAATRRSTTTPTQFIQVARGSVIRRSSIERILGSHNRRWRRATARVESWSVFPQSSLLKRRYESCCHRLEEPVPSRRRARCA